MSDLELEDIDLNDPRVGGINEKKGGIEEIVSASSSPPSAKGGIEEVLPAKNPKKGCFTVKKLIVAIVLLMMLVILGVGAGVALHRHTSVQEIQANAAVTPIAIGGFHSGPHKWICGNETFDLLIDGTSVKLGPKVFNPREIV